MIPLRDQEYLGQRFQKDLANRVRIDYFSQRPSRIYVPGREDCQFCEETRLLLEELASLSDRISLTVHELSESKELAQELAVDKVPAIVIRGQTNRPVRFFGIPTGNEFPGFVETLLDAARGTVDLKAETMKALRKVKSDVEVQVFVTPTCPYYPSLARTAHKFALQNPHLSVEVVEVNEFPALGQRLGIRAVPTTVIDAKVMIPGAMDESALLANIQRAVSGRPQGAAASVGATTAVPVSSPQPAPRPGGLILP